MWIIIANNYWAFITWRCCATRCIIITCNVLFLLKINKETHHGHQLHSLNHCWAHGCGQKVVKGLCCTSGNHDDCLYQFSREMKQCKRYKPLLTLCPWDSPDKNTGVGCHFLLSGMFLTHELNLHPLHWQADSLPLNHMRSPWAEGQ